LLERDCERYATFWTEFGAVLKQGLVAREEPDRREALLELVLSPSSQSADGFTTLAEYVTRMKPGQAAIYYLTGLSREAVAQSPHLEAFREKGYEVLYLTDPVDELWTTAGLEFSGHKFQSVGKGEVDLEAKDEKSKETPKEAEGDYAAVLEGLRALLADDVKEVRLSSRLVASPACLVSEEKDFSPQMDELMRRMGHKVEQKKRILEVNPKHELVAKLRSRFAADPKAPDLATYARLLYGQALLAEGSQLPDAASYGRLIAELMTKAM
jgi:molecular chaperone HtpG